MDTNLGQIVLVKDIYPGIEDDYTYYLENFTEFNDKLYFNANDGENGTELWVSDGTTKGTQLLADIATDTNDYNGSYPEYSTEFNDKLYFAAGNRETGRELWVTDGTAEGTQLLKDINPNTGDFKGSYPEYSTEFNDKLYFTADDGKNGAELWVSDGTTEGTQLLKDLYPGADIYPLDFPPTIYNSFPRDFTESNDRLFFAAKSGGKGSELWVSDGTAENTQLLKDIYPGGYGRNANSAFPTGLTEFKDKLYFAANDGQNGTELWVSDGTTKGTQLLKDIYPGSKYNEPYFFGDYDSNYAPGYYSPLDSDPRYFIEFKSRLYFTANSGKDGKEIGNELWVTDGTAKETQLFKDINPGRDGFNTSSYADNFIEFGDRLYFTANDGETGQELWVSDGTPEGTNLFADINPGSDSSYVGDLTIFNDRLYFTADDGETGRELWVSDGTTEGTQLVTNLNSQVDHFGEDSSSYLRNLTVVGDELFFSADNGETGRELFKLTFDDSAPDMTYIAGTNLSDILIGTEGADRIEGLKGEDILGGKAGNDLLKGGSDDDVLFGVEGDDTLTGGNGNDLLRGQSGNDILKGGVGDDTLFGGNQFDRLNGGDGDDFLDGARGIAIYNGGAGSDRFVIRDDSQTVWIQDFELGVDEIELTGGMTFDRLEITGDVNSFISLQGEQIGVLLGVEPDDLNASNFRET